MKNDLINRQEAINIVRHECGEWKGLAKEIVKQFNGLPTAKIVTECNDLISRLAAIDTVKKHLKETDALDIYPGIVGAIREWLNDLPSVEPQRIRGHWIKVDDDLISGKCSVCGWEAHLYEDDVVGMNYCPNCGARLEDIVNEF